MSMRIRMLSAVAAIVLGLSAAAQAVIINVDLDVADNVAGPPLPAGTYTGVGATGVGGTWNGLGIGTKLVPQTSFTSGFLLDSGGGTTTAVFSLLDSYLPYDSTQDPMPAGVAPELLNDFAANPIAGSTTSFSITGLTDGNYELILYSTNGGYNGAATVFVVAGFGGGTRTAVGNNVNPATFTENTNYVRYANVTVAGGALSGTFTAESVALQGSLNGFQLISVPEPASIAILSLGGLGLLARRRQSIA